MKKLIRLALAGLFALIALSVVRPAAAQVCPPNTPAHTVIGRIGVPGDTGACQAIPFAQLTGLLTTFTQTGAGAVGATFDQLYRGQIFSPVMWGAFGSPAGTPAISVVNNQTRLQSEINAMQAAGGGVLELGPGVYGIGNGLVIGNNIVIRGAGVHSTTLLLQPNTSTVAINFANGAGLVSNCGISDLSINTADTTTSKVGVNFTDATQCFATNIMVSAYPTGQWTAPAGFAVGIGVQGRELGVINNVQVYADSPIELSADPHLVNSGVDSWTFNDLTLVGELSAATHHLIVVDTGVALTNIKFAGHQNWIGGVDGFHWVDTTSAVISEGLWISGIKSEQAPGTTGYTVNIQSNTTLYGLHISDGIGGDRNGFKMKHVADTTISSFNFLAGVGGLDGLNIDSSDGTVKLDNAFFLSGTTATISGLNACQLSAAATNGSTALPPRAFYSNAACLETFGPIAFSSVTLTNIAAPSSPAAGKDTLYADSTDLRFHDKNASGVIGTTVVADTGATNNFVTAISAAGGISKAQPAFSNLSGQATFAQLPSLSANQLLGALTATTPSGQSVPSCSTSASALQWASGTGFACNTAIAASTVVTNANLTGAVTSVGNATSLGSFTSANLSTALTDETGSGLAVFGTSPILTTVDARGVWTAGATWTLPAHTLAGTISGGGNNINNVILGAVTPLAITGTTITGNTSVSSPVINATTATSGYQLGGVIALSTIATNFTAIADPTGTSKLFFGNAAASDVNNFLATTHNFSNATNTSTFFSITANGMGYGTAGIGGSITQITSRNTGVTLSKVTGDIVLLAGINAAVSAATANTVVVTNTTVAINDTISISQKSGTDKYLIVVTNVAAGSFAITFFTTGGTTNESPVFHFNVFKGVNSFLLNRDLDPASNDNSPAFTEKAA